jgi:hypothetical protein
MFQMASLIVNNEILLKSILPNIGEIDIRNCLQWMLTSVISRHRHPQPFFLFHICLNTVNDSMLNHANIFHDYFNSALILPI